MDVMTNPEVRRNTVIHIIVTLIFSAVIALSDILSGVLCLSMGTVLLAVYLITEKIRHDKITDLCNEIDRILTGGEQIKLDDFSEGDMSILQSEIRKLTIRLGGQNTMLKTDKVLMKDSIADISHQLRTPFTTMNLVLSMLSKPGLSRQETSRYVRELSRLLNRTDWLIDDMLKLSQFDAGVVELERKFCGVRELIRSSAEPIEIPLELKGIEFAADIPENVCAEIDFKWTREAVGNILKNCMEHTPENGIIRVSAEENPLYTEIIISDSGNGIAPKDLPHIFRRFYRTSDTDGYGIGLALAQRIVKSQNGIIEARNGETGAEFTVRIYKTTV